MKTIMKAALLLGLVSFSVSAQQTIFQDSFYKNTKPSLNEVRGLFHIPSTQILIERYKEYPILAK
jgi:hypothetical protein